LNLFLKNILQSQSVKNVSVLATGAFIVQTISVILSPVLSRLYTPEDYGLLAIFTSIISILTVMGSFRYELAILIPKKNSEASLLLKLSVFIVILISLIVLVVTILFNQNISHLFGNDNLSFWLWFIAPVFLSAGIVQAFTYWLNRIKNYKLISAVRIFQSVTNSSLSLILGFLKYHTSGLLAALIFSNIASLVFLIRKSRSSLKNCVSNLGGLKIISDKFREFPLLSLPGALLDTLSINSVIFLLGFFFSESVTGSYSFSYKILTLPSVLIGASIGQVLFQKISETYSNNQKILPSILKTWKLLFFAGLIPMILIFVFGENLFRFVFGDRWSDAGKISEYLCLLTYFMLISSPTSNAMIVLRKQKFLLWTSIAVFIYRPLALYFGYLTDNFMNGIIMFVALETIQILIFNLFLLKFALDSDKKIPAA